MAGRMESVGTLLLIEKEHLLPLPAEDFDLAEVSFPRVDQAGCAKVRTNFYSVPLKSGTVVEARVYSSQVEFRQNGVRVARHERSHDRARQILDLEHYLDVLEQKPGALRGSKPLALWRAQGRWPESYDRLWELMTSRHGRQAWARLLHAYQGRKTRPSRSRYIPTRLRRVRFNSASLDDSFSQKWERDAALPQNRIYARADLRRPVKFCVNVCLPTFLGS
ncbi:MAG TPA: hypothetical protein VFC37_11525 [Terracidiphilus sp.]|nr:hypothetical protein [Terracidiphilus sp.]